MDTIVYILIVVAFVVYIAYELKYAPTMPDDYDELLNSNKMDIRIKKLEEREDATHPHNIPEGNERVVVGIMETHFELPKVGERFVLNGTNRWFITSEVVEILNDTTFKTLNSIYEWEVLEKISLDDIVNT